MRKFIIIVLISGIIFPLFSQNGYLDFKWGMGMDEVLTMLDIVDTGDYTNHSPFPDIFDFLMYYRHGVELINRFNNEQLISVKTSLKIIDGKEVYNWNVYETRFWNNYYFYFENGKLFGVVFRAPSVDMLYDLRQNYGNEAIVNFGKYNIDLRVWQNKNRYILRYKSNSYQTDTIGFFDIQISNKYLDLCIESNRIAKAINANVLD